MPILPSTHNARGLMGRARSESRRGLTSSSESSGSDDLIETGQMFEMNDLDGRGRRSADASSSLSSSTLTVVGEQPVRSEDMNPESDDDGDYKKPMPPEVNIRAQPVRPPLPQRLRGLGISRSIVAILDRYNLDATELFEDPRLRALVLVLPLWILNWFY